MTGQSGYTRRMGRSGENAAVQFLIRRGYSILHRNYRAERGEIDIIARDRNILVFVEVKMASTDKFGSPETWVDQKKQTQIAKVAQAYLTEQELEDVDCRFDVIAISQSNGCFEINHFQDAFWL